MTYTQSNEYRKGLLYALGCYLMWGIFPLYWYPITHSPISADQILAQRICWSAIFSIIVLISMQQTGNLIRAMHNRKLLLTFIGSAFAISLNWLVYLWAITNNHILDASLGYFISPLFNVFLGFIFFKETLNRTQVVAIMLAVVGILWLAVPAGHIPWVSLLLAGSFGLYSLLRKLAPLDALTGMTLETLVLVPFALAYLLYVAQQGHLVFSSLEPLPMVVLIGSGMVTVLPLLLFAAGARRISMSDLGMIQYVSPSMQFVLGLTLFQEVFNIHKLVGYAWVWLGIAVYILGVVKLKKKPAS